MDLRAIAGRACAEALALVLPVSCAGCGTPDVALCEGCEAGLVPVPAERRLASGLVVRSALRFDGVPARVVRALKEEGRCRLARPLGRALAEVAPAAASASFVPVPSSGRALRRRGFDVVEELLRGAGLPGRRLLRAVGGAVDQRSLDARARLRNVAGAYRARSAAGGHDVVIVDDVVTTGATLMAAERALRRAGARVLGAVTVADTPHRHGASKNAS